MKRADTPARRELARLLQERIEADGASQPLSDNQKSMWYVHQTDPDGHAYNVVWSARWIGALDVDLLRHAMKVLGRRHPQLRAVFDDSRGEVRQRTRESWSPQLELTDCGSCRDLEALRRAGRGVARRPFDLRSDLPFRMHVLRWTDTEHLVVFVAHHIVCDGRTLVMAYDELIDVYLQLVRGDGAVISDEPDRGSGSYHDFVEWQVGWLQEHRSTARGFWRGRLTDGSDVRVPDDRGWVTSEPDTRSFSVPVSPRVQQDLGSAARRMGCTVTALVVCLYRIVLTRLAGAAPAIGLAASGRTQRAYRDVFGHFVNPVVLTRSDVPSDIDLGALARLEGQGVLEALEHQDLPFTEVVRMLGLGTQRGESPAFRYLCVVQQLSRAPKGFGALYAGEAQAESESDFGHFRLAPCKIGHQEGQFDLSLEAIQTRNGFTALLKYRTEQFSEETMIALSAALSNALEGVVRDPGMSLDALLVHLSATEVPEIDRWNTREFPVDHAWPLSRRFEEVAASHPDTPALVYGAREWSYGAVERMANQLAHHLVGRGVTPGQTIAVRMQRGPALIVALLAIHKSGAIYMPIAPDLPRGRVEFMLDDARPVMSLVAEGPGVGPGRLFVSLDDWRFDDELHSPLEFTPRRDGAAYLIYTSGSTGRPKGVLNRHESITNHIMWLAGACSLSAADRVMQKTPHGFDVSYCEVMWCLVQGATLVIAEPDGHKDPHYMGRLIRSAGVTAMHVVPTQLRALLNAALDEFSRLRVVISAGEALPIELVRSVHRSTAVRLFNLYGPTEAAVGVAWWDTHEIRDGQSAVPIGRPWGNTEVHVVDPHGRPVAVGAVGELLVVGCQVASGYLNRPELTTERFVPNALGRGRPGYLTGDLGRFLPDGTIAYLGRIDHQVKLRGYRIELGEIDEALRQVDGISDAATIVHGDGEARRLVAYVVTTREITDNEVRTALAMGLPDYMIPVLLVRMAALPLNHSGKVDRKRLPADIEPVAIGAGESVGPTTDLQRAIARIWCAVLDRDEVDSRVGFFAAGGHSLLLATVQHRLKEVLAIDVSMAHLLTYPSIESLAASLDRAGEADGPIELETVRRPRRSRLGARMRRIRGAQENGGPSS